MLKLRCLLGLHKTPPYNEGWGGRWWWPKDEPHALCAYCDKEAPVGIWVFSAEGRCAPYSDSWTIDEANEAWREFENRSRHPYAKYPPGTYFRFQLTGKSCRRCGHDKWYHYTGQLLKRFEKPCKGDHGTCTCKCYTRDQCSLSLTDRATGYEPVFVGVRVPQGVLPEMTVEVRPSSYNIL